MMTTSGPKAQIARPASTALSCESTAKPHNNSASDSFRIRYVSRCRQESGKRRAGARFSMIRRPVRGGQFDHVLQRVRRNLALQHDQFGCGDQVAGSVDVGPAQAVVRAGSHGQIVVSIVADHDQRRTAGYAGFGDDEFRVDLRRPQVIEDRRAVAVVAHAVDQGDVAARPGRRHRLIGPLAAERLQEDGLRHRLAAFRQVSHFHNQIDIGTADDNNLAGHGCSGITNDTTPQSPFAPDCIARREDKPPSTACFS